MSVSGPKKSESRNCYYGSVSGPRNWQKTSVSGSRNWRFLSVSFLDPETDIMDQFLGPETDIMGEGNFMDCTLIGPTWPNPVLWLVNLGRSWKWPSRSRIFFGVGASRPCRVRIISYFGDPSWKCIKELKLGWWIFCYEILHCAKWDIVTINVNQPCKTKWGLLMK